MSEFISQSQEVTELDREIHERSLELGMLERKRRQLLQAMGIIAIDRWSE